MPIVLKFGSLNLLEPSGPVQTCNGIALPLLLSLPLPLHLPLPLPLTLHLHLYLYLCIYIFIIIYLTANGLSPGGSGYNACT